MAQGNEEVREGMRKEVGGGGGDCVTNPWDHGNYSRSASPWISAENVEILANYVKKCPTRLSTGNKDCVNWRNIKLEGRKKA
ncbi:hypothetical protein KS4_09570 [Poriferisphaera corsica]|uniref:Uncharacterized protein n=1 Tax=Poriferisphaera corsica TaxID=2528020 RepID=A0A517YRS8_9BACT|nr:hypothetical protein KS4_09570 [Poriferisphaera corsica]